MSERVENGSAGQGPATKAERRLAAQLAAKKAAEAKRRRQSMLGAFVGVLAVAALIGGIVWLNQGDDKQPNASSAADATATPAPNDEPAAPPAAELPADADPALKTKPQVGAGTGELKKLNVTTLIKGTGPAVKAGQQITTNYVGVFYKDGKEFDSSWDRGQPATFGIGVGQVIPGWDQGLVGVPVGSRVQLDIPGELAYGNESVNGRPGGPLRFVVDVLAAQ
ncbi:FKBP-type peptidyl-prolyl cis-trans isomerase [Micromonospora narathiwatensis]|uniref:Peptidyl-prolyl cis-trans isomerase n=1 Tax=Micromonospora narathiwatensis TaxID=299146 RepID=A0A1A9AC63_9ACTN|nr:FKBP-type peptidyl-prolyl cis-trans isomerase [Micromonospora narathiwatensis]SBT54098.1 peptidylprolyl isomerase [Micromonospora narathiwatensis]